MIYPPLFLVQKAYDSQSTATNTSGNTMAYYDTNRIKGAAPIIFGDSANHSPIAANNLGDVTDEMALASVLTAKARQSAKFDFAQGEVGGDWALEWNLGAVIEFALAVAAGTTIKFYVGYSPSATVGQGNSAELDGTDNAWTGITGGSEAASVLLLHLIGTMTLDVNTAGAAQVNTSINKFTPRLRYGQLVVMNNSGQTLISNNDEMSVALTPMDYAIRD